MSKELQDRLSIYIIQDLLTFLTSICALSAANKSTFGAQFKKIKKKACTDLEVHVDSRQPQNAIYEKFIVISAVWPHSAFNLRSLESAEEDTLKSSESTVCITQRREDPHSQEFGFFFIFSLKMRQNSNKYHFKIINWIHMKSEMSPVCIQFTGVMDTRSKNANNQELHPRMLGKKCTGGAFHAGISGCSWNLKSKAFVAGFVHFPNSWGSFNFFSPSSSSSPFHDWTQAKL